MEMVGPVQSLFKTSSKHDVVVKGTVLKLKLDPCRCGVNARWVVEIKAFDAVPSFMHHMMPEEDRNKVLDKTVEEWHFEPTWFQRHILRKKLETELKKWIVKSKERFAEVNRLEAQVEKLRTLI